MATIQGSTILNPNGYDVSWLAMGNADSGTAVTVPRNVNQLTFGVAGTFGGATVVLEGSMDNSTWATMKDFNGNAISITVTPAIVALAGVPTFVRARTSGGTGTAINAYLHGTLAN